MTEDQRIDTRLQCLTMATHACGEDVEYQYVLETAKAYIDFVFGKKLELRLVREDEDGG